MRRLARAGAWLILATPWLLSGATTNGYVAIWGEDAYGLNTPPSASTNVTAVACGLYHSLALTTEGRVIAWGPDWSGETKVPTSVTNARAISAGAYFSVALRSNGTVVAWGAGDGGQTNVPTSLTDAKAISAGYYHTLALRSNGTVMAWGSGLGATVPAGLSGVVAIAAGNTHNVAVKSDGKVVCWGDGAYGKTNVPSYLNTYVAVAVAAGENHSLALLKNGWVAGWGNNLNYQINTAGLTGVAMISAGLNHSLVLFSNRNIAVLTDNFYGQGDISSTLSNTTVAVVAGGNRCMAVAVVPAIITAQPQTNQSIMVGSNVSFSVSASGSQPIYYQWLKNGGAISAATNSSYALTNAQSGDSGVYSVVVSNLTGFAVSSNANLTVNRYPSITSEPADVERLEGSGPITFSVGATGTEPLRYQWRKDGVNLVGQTNSSYLIWIVQEYMAGGYSAVVSNSFGSVTSRVATLTVRTAPSITQQPLAQTVYEGTVAKFQVGASNATAYQWRKGGVDIEGANEPEYTISNVQSGDAGDYSVMVSNPWARRESDSARLTVQVPAPGSAKILTVGLYTEVWNGSSYIDIRTPSIGNPRQLAVGLFHGLALLNDGSVLGWGDNQYGQAVPPPGLTGVSNIAAGSCHSLALTGDGRVVAWGANLAGQASPPAKATNLTAIAAGGNHSLAVRLDGTVVGWGSNSFGQATPPSSMSSNMVAVAAGFEHSLALRQNGTVAAWGRNSESQTSVPAALANPTTAGVVAIVAGGFHSLALRSNGTVVCWGSTQYNMPKDLTNVVALAAGDYHSLALKRDGTVTAWGANNYGQIDIPPSLTGVTAIAAGANRSLLVVQRHLSLLPPQRAAGNGVTLWLGYKDGSEIDPSMLGSVEIRASTDPNATFSAWTAYTSGFVLTNNLIRWDDPDAALLPRRYYRSIEKP